jgi:hypothetical protein
MNPELIGPGHWQILTERKKKIHSGRLTERIGPRLPMATGLALCGVSLLAMSSISQC